MTKKTGALFNILGTSNFWLDMDAKKKTLEAYKQDKSFEPVTIIDDRYKL